jgi:L-fuculose-phosphate aldolase
MAISEFCSQNWADALEGAIQLKLGPEQQLAVLADALAQVGYCDHIAGHITIRGANGTLLCSPWGLPWDQISASDVICIDHEGNRLHGRWPVPPGIPLHLALHKRRPATGVAVHNHPEWSGLWAAMHQVPPVLDQTGALIGDRVSLVDEFGGAVDDAQNAEAVIDKLGDSDVGLLANHGTFIIADDIPTVFLRCYSFEWRCKRAAQVARVGEGISLRPAVLSHLAQTITTAGFPGFWSAAAKQAVLRRPAVLF